MKVPTRPKIYHILHMDRLPSIIADGYLWCDAEMIRREPAGTPIGMNHIKERRLQLPLSSHRKLFVGACVPFYFCPRSIMLYLIYRSNPELEYRGGQEPIVHLEADFRGAVAWAEKNQKRWAFTLSNAGSRFFEDRCDLAQVHEIDWNAVQTHNWQHCKDGKQAEFLLEHCFPWTLVERIGVYTSAVRKMVERMVKAGAHQPEVQKNRRWYY